MARVEFRAVQEEVLDLIEKGYGCKMIYDQLAKANKINMTYRTFWQYVKGTKTKEKAAVETKPGNRTLYTHDPKPDKESLI